MLSCYIYIYGQNQAKIGGDSNLEHRSTAISMPALPRPKKCGRRPCGAHFTISIELPDDARRPLWAAASRRNAAGDKKLRWPIEAPKQKKAAARQESSMRDNSRCRLFPFKTRHI